MEQYRRQVMSWDEFNVFLDNTPEDDIVDWYTFDDMNPMAEPMVQVSYFVRS